MPNSEMDEELRDLASAPGYEQHGVDDAAASLEDAFLGDELDELGGVPQPYQPEIKTQPCNKATMVCLRGPCIHHWAMTTKYGPDMEEKVNIRRHRVCMRHAHETELQDVHVYVCDGWKPALLAWVPDSVWPHLQRHVRAAWERHLERQGYNFDWRHFSLDSFEWDSPERRRFSGPGGGHLYDQWKATKEGTTGYGASVPEEKE